MNFAQKCHFSLFGAGLAIYMNGLSVFSAVFFHVPSTLHVCLSFLVTFWRLYEIFGSEKKYSEKFRFLKILRSGSKKFFCPKSVKNDHKTLDSREK